MRIRCRLFQMLHAILAISVMYAAVWGIVISVLRSMETL